MVSFGGWDMPMQYTGVLSEHMCVRNRVGLFDISHMGRIEIIGPDAESFLDYLSTRSIKGKKAGSATYTVWCNENGGTMDDLIIYKINDTHFFVVTNASNREKDLAHLKMHAHSYHVTIQDHFSSGILALQGPLATPLLSKFFPEVNTLPPMRFLSLENNEFYLSRTGYTGAGGFELYGSAEKISQWWDILLKEGKTVGIQPIGLGARDTLRLEMGFALYGHELSETIAPSESVSAWTINWNKPDFLGKTALRELEKNSRKRHAYGVRLIEKGIARQGSPVIQQGRTIGEVTSGTFSPSLEQGIALILVNQSIQIGERVALLVRQTQLQAEVVELPFVRKIA